MKKSETFVSIILVSENKSSELVEYIKSVESIVNNKFSDYEIVIVDQASTDNTDYLMDKVLSEYKSIRYIKLTQKVQSDVAIAAGVENAIGDFVVYLNIDFDSELLIDKFVSEAKSGADILIGVSNNSSSQLYKRVRRVSKTVLDNIGYTLPSNSTGSFCLSRRAVNAITESGRFYCKFFVKMANVGYSVKAFNCDGFIGDIPKKSVVSGIKETMHHMVFNSTKPLRFMSFIGIIGSSLAMLFSFYSLIINILNEEVAKGWTTTILFMSFLFTLLFIMLSFFGEYLSRLLDERKDHKEYNVVFEKNSSVMLDENRENVLFSSVCDDLNLVQTRRDK
ncbi:glycosyltransferase [Photobacterium leiognathi]|uniref:glycosyltransferase n=1 Tax=Photobacterium leiognathi TaxID=553611 RepID=UPI0029810DB5|nr:glycosyltransferase [Photobacterium leiognathi]